MAGHYSETGRGGHPAEAEAMARIGQLVARVHALRQLTANRAERVRCAREVFEASIADLLGQGKAAHDAVTEAEAELRAAAMTYHDNHPDQKTIVANAVTVKDFAVVEYDATDAFDWALEHKLYLKLNTTEFERLAKASPAIVPFVTVRAEPRVQLATDMEKALGALETEEVPRA